MQSRSLQREIGVRGPFDACETTEDVENRVEEFLRRTGLLDYDHYFRVGAFLARRPFGEIQVQYLKRAHETEDANSENRLPGSENKLPAEANNNRQLRREYEYDMLSREGNRGRWPIFWRQKWRVHALVLCCSLGAAIQGWDETAVNGGSLELPWLWSPLTCVSAQLYYPEALRGQGPRLGLGLIGLINSAPYLMCIFSCS